LIGFPYTRQVGYFVISVYAYKGVRLNAVAAQGSKEKFSGFKIDTGTGAGYNQYVCGKYSVAGVDSPKARGVDNYNIVYFQQAASF
jgi:hypothetical protein